MADYINVNGQLLAYEDAGIAPADAGVLHGAGLFETMRAKGGTVFRLRQHLERLTRSAEILSIGLSLGEKQLADMISELLDANGLEEARVRLTVTRGDLHAATLEDPLPPVTLILSAQALGAYPNELYAKGMNVAIAGYKQNPENPLTGHKVTSYFDRLLGLRAAQELKCGEALWFTSGSNFLAEGCISNVFIVDKDGIIATPPLTVEGKTNQRLCLPGITRGVVIEAAAAQNELVHERMLTIHDLLSAKEVFLTNAMMGVMPVTAIEKHVVGDGQVGPRTRSLREGYLQIFEDGTTKR